MSDDEFLNELANIDVNEDELDDWLDDDELEATPPKPDPKKRSTIPPVTVAAPPKPSPPVTASPPPKEKPNPPEPPKAIIPVHYSTTTTKPSTSVVKTTTTTNKGPQQGKLQLQQQNTAKSKKPTAEATTTKSKSQASNKSESTEKSLPLPAKQQQVKTPPPTTTAPPPPPPPPPPLRSPHPQSKQQLEAKKPSSKPTTEPTTKTAPLELPTPIQGGKDDSKEEQAVETSSSQSDGTTGGGWDFFGKITSVAAIAVKDITDLGQSFSEVLVEAANAAEADDEGAEGEGLQVSSTGITEEGVSTGGKALTSIWGWVSSTATTMAKELTDTAMEAGPALEAVKSNVGSQASRTRAEFKLAQTLTDVAKGASSFIQSGLAPIHGNDDDDDNVDVDVDGTITNNNIKKSQNAMTFPELYALFGGEEAQQDLEALSSECSRSCHRYRAGIGSDEDATNAFEALFSLLQPLYDLELEASNHEQVVSSKRSSEPPMIQLEKGHQIITNIVSSGIDRANSMQKGEEEKQNQVGQVDKNNDDEEEQEEQQGDKYKKMVEMEGRKRLAEVAAVCTERLLALGRSIHMMKKTGRPSDDGINWPKDDAVTTSVLLRGQADVMEKDVKAVHTAFVAALGDRGDSDSEGEKTNKLLLEDIDAASRRIKDCFRLLFFVGLQCGVIVVG